VPWAIELLDCEHAGKDELVARKIVPQATYDKLTEQIVAKQPNR
jgi:hypothetical protein